MKPAGPVCLTQLDAMRKAYHAEHGRQLARYYVQLAKGDCTIAKAFWAHQYGGDTWPLVEEEEGAA